MLFLISFYACLIFLSIAIFILGWQTWKITKEYCIPLTTFFLFYFTFAGAYFFAADAYSGFKGAAIGLHYYLIFDRMFPVRFDLYYVQACLYYAVFVLVFQLLLLFFLKRLYRKRNINNQESALPFRFEINPYSIFFISVGLIALSIFCLRDEILFAIQNCQSVYLVTRNNHNRLYTIHQLANEFCVLIPFIAYAVFISESRKISLSVKQVKWAKFILLTTCFIAALYITFLGNRRELLSALIICSLLFINNFKKASLGKYGLIFGLSFVMFLSNDVIRSTMVPTFLNKIFLQNTTHFNRSPEKIISNNTVSKNDKLKQAISSFVLSNELFYAHFSMYGVLEHQIKPTNGSSIKYLASSIIPRVFMSERPDDIYTYYVKEINAAPGQIYTLHNATGWYLNFGLFGIVLGATIIAFFFITAFHLQSRRNIFKNKFLIILSDMALVLISAQFVTFITAGPEAYKAMLIEGIILPVLIFSIISKKEKVIDRNLP